MRGLIPWSAFVTSLYEERYMLFSCKYLSSAGLEVRVQLGEPAHLRLQVSGLGQRVVVLHTVCVCELWCCQDCELHTTDFDH